MTAEYLIRPNLSISGWVGPQYTSTKTVVGIPLSWTDCVLHLIQFLVEHVGWSEFLLARTSQLRASRVQSPSVGWRGDPCDYAGQFCKWQLPPAVDAKDECDVGSAVLSTTFPQPSRAVPSTTLRSMRGWLIKLARSLDGHGAVRAPASDPINTIIIGSSNLQCQHRVESQSITPGTTPWDGNYDGRI